MKQITCITCPIGCRITIDLENDVFSGNKCQKGLEFAKTELTAPKRTLTSTVRTIFQEFPVVSVRTKGEVPKERIPEIMRELGKITISQKMSIGDTLVTNILNTGCDIIITANLVN